MGLLAQLFGWNSPKDISSIRPLNPWERRKIEWMVPDEYAISLNEPYSWKELEESLYNGDTEKFLQFHRDLEPKGTITAIELVQGIPIRMTAEATDTLVDALVDKRIPYSIKIDDITIDVVFDADCTVDTDSEIVGLDCDLSQLADRFEEKYVEAKRTYLIASFRHVGAPEMKAFQCEIVSARECIRDLREGVRQNRHLGRERLVRYFGNLDSIEELTRRVSAIRSPYRDLKERLDSFRTGNSF